MSDFNGNSAGNMVFIAILFAKRIGDADILCFIVAGEDVVNVFGFSFCCKRADNGNDNKTAYHCENAGEKGVFKYERKQGAGGNISNSKRNEKLYCFKSDTEDE